MNTTALVLLAAAVGLVSIVALWMVGRTLHELRELRRHPQPDPSQALVVLQQQLDALREQVRLSLDGGRAQIDRRLEETHRVVGDVRRGLGEVDRQVRQVTRTARDLRSLQELLRSPKVRGGMGEMLLGELLADVLPRAHFDLQHEFPGGERVDAVVRLGERLVPVDAKFPLENFRRMRAAVDREETDAERSARRQFRADVRRHVDAIAKRYIRPGDGTFEFALMYVPAEGVYQEILSQQPDDGLDLFHHSIERRVVPVSPQSFFAYLQVIVLGLRGMSIESRAREIMDQIGDLDRRLDRFGESFELVGKHLGNANRQYDEASKRLARIDAAVDGMAGRVDDEALPHLVTDDAGHRTADH